MVIEVACIAFPDSSLACHPVSSFFAARTFSAIDRYRVVAVVRCGQSSSVILPVSFTCICSFLSPSLRAKRINVFRQQKHTLALAW
jgi:hypothetical protein